MTNQFDLSATEAGDASLRDEAEGTAWRPIGAVASAWVARLAAERQAAQADGFAPVAWAAE